MEVIRDSMASIRSSSLLESWLIRLLPGEVVTFPEPTATFPLGRVKPLAALPTVTGRFVRLAIGALGSVSPPEGFVAVLVGPAALPATPADVGRVIPFALTTLFAGSREEPWLTPMLLAGSRVGMALPEALTSRRAACGTGIFERLDEDLAG